VYSEVQKLRAIAPNGCCVTVIQNTKVAKRNLGFSIVELIVSMLVILIIAAIAVPAVVKTVQFYQLNDAAMRVAGVLKMTRYEAIRKNAQINCWFQVNGTDWTIWTDSNGNSQPDPTEAQTIVNGTFSLMAGGAPVPDPGPIDTALSGAPLTVVSGANTSVSFDQRGALTNTGGPLTTVLILYIGNANDPSTGYRAIVVLPGGTTQVWATSSAGDWHRVS
jgi:prepilin-type N-terminal cleavage/methylation domain-containing protein